jgi:transcriptional regulator with XRE-family HTH domain
MSKNCENRYKLCRETAGFTQEQASEQIHVGVRQLSDYENGKARVPDDVVERMATIYDAKLLAWWHLKTFHPLGKFLPDLIEPQTSGDMAFQAILARDELDPAVNEMKKIVADGIIDDDESQAFSQCIKQMRDVTGKLISVTTYAEKLGGDKG